MTICIAEDRKSCETALKLLIASLAKHCRHLSINVFYPPATPTFLDWAKRYPKLIIHDAPLAGAYGWNVKPQAILYLLDHGHDQVIWIDSDIIVTQDAVSLFRELDGDTMIITEEALWGAHDDSNAMRARLWGFPVGRILPFTLNTGVVRVTKYHIPLLRRWRELLESEAYRKVQALNWQDRPSHMVSDQDVLTALLASADYAQVPLKILTRGNDIIQYFGLYGYTVYERVMHIIFGLPTFVHSQGVKPWIPLPQGSRSVTLRSYIESVYLDLSPYTLLAASLRDQLDEDCRWMRAHYRLSFVMRVAGVSYVPLVGLPIALISDLNRLAGRMFRRRRKR